MQILIHQQMNIIPGIVLLLFLTYACTVLDKSSVLNRIYLHSLVLNLVLIALTIVFKLIDKMENALHHFSYLLAFTIFVLFPLLSYMYLKFVCFYFSSPIKLKKSTNNVFIIIIITNTFITAVMMLFGKHINGFNIYAVPFITSMVFLVYCIFIIMANKKMLIKFEYIYIITITLVSSLFIIVQLFRSETKFIWYSSTFTLVLMFIVIQQRELYRDTLTGAKNRLVLKKLLDDFVRRPGKRFSAVMIDLDYFKNINDSYGHSEGDTALKNFVKILQKVYSDCGVVIRTGGDEFLVLIYEISNIEISELIHKTTKLVDKYNEKSLKPYRIRYSCAYGTYNSSELSIDQFMHEIDMKMYESKNEKKGKLWSIENM